MKTTLAILMSGILLCGCAHMQSVSSQQAFERIQPGRDIALSKDAVMRVAKREGDRIEGIRIVTKTPDGREIVATAPTGALLPGSIENPEDPNCFRLILHNVVQTKDGRFQVSAGEATIVCGEPL